MRNDSAACVCLVLKQVVLKDVVKDGAAVVLCWNMCQLCEDVSTKQWSVISIS